MIKLVDQLIWKFENRGPYVQTEYLEEVDPTPCSHHNMELVKEKVNEITKLFAIKPETNWYVLGYEVTSRVNGQTSSTGGYRDDDDDNFQTFIVLSGKRIVIHPAMTRYLVAHEYGHAMHLYAARQMKKLDKEARVDLVYTPYMELRGIKEPDEYYGPTTWHNSVGEIFANDFRVLNGIETEFWPHDVLRPEKIKGLEEFFADLKSKYEYDPNRVVEVR